MKKLAIIQARMGSTRLPGKVLLDLAGEPMLARVVNRVSRARTLDEVLVATTSEPADDAIAGLCADRKWLYFRGSETDVLDRYYRAASEREAQVVVRVTSDCPLIDASVIDAAVELRSQLGADYCSNVIHRGFPRGLDVEVFSMAALEEAWREDRRPESREHVTQFMVRHPERFRQADLPFDTDHSDKRWTVDTPEDFELMTKIYNYFGQDTFSWTDVLALLSTHPEWSEINRHIEQKKV